MPEFYTWDIFLINQQDEIGEKQLSVYGSIGGQNSPLMHAHVPLYPAHKCQNAKNCWHFNIYQQDKYSM